MDCRRACVLVTFLAACDRADGRLVEPVRADSVAAVPRLPVTPYPYSDAQVPIPRHFLLTGPTSTIGADNTPAGNVTSDAGATLGRVLFYDRLLSANGRIACASCHQQARGFSDSTRFSRGFRGVTLRRRTMALANARFYRSGRFFWDERAPTLEAQVLQPIQDTVEMGMQLAALEARLRGTSYYPALFEAAFGSPEVTSDRIARALAQFVRAMVSSESPFDSAFMSGSIPDFSVLTPQARQGGQLFSELGCANCHRTSAHFTDDPRNTGLALAAGDSGAGRGRFKAPSLRNVGVRPPYMHDGRFATLEQVVEFYDTGVQVGPDLDLRMRNPDGSPRRLKLSAEQRAALVAFLHALTDRAFLQAPRFSDPFVETRVAP